MTLYTKELMQFGSAFQRFHQKIFQADPKWASLFIIKVDIYDGFYQSYLQEQGLVGLGLVMQLNTRFEEPLIAFPLSDPIRLGGTTTFLHGPI